jgi:hypothetical protein
MNDLPDDVLRLICEKCPATTRASLECVSKRFQSISSALSLRLHITPKHVPVEAWLEKNKDRLTRISMRRVFRHIFALYFPNVRVVDIMYTTVRFWNTPQFCDIPRLEKLRVCCLSRRFGQPDVFRTSLLPSTLRDVILTLDDTWRRVDIDRAFPRMALRCHPGRALIQQPDFHVTSLDGCSELYLKTFGCITTTIQRPTTISKTVIECEDNFLPRGVLRWFGPALETCVLRMPAASFVASLDLTHVNPKSLELEGMLVVIDAIGSQLQTLKVKAKRFASIAIPPNVDSQIVVNGEAHFNGAEHP